jgi:hypothetical protein
MNRSGAEREAGPRIFERLNPADALEPDPIGLNRIGLQIF